MALTILNRCFLLPNLPTHIHFALNALDEVSGNIGHSNADEYLPVYLLGATAPDIRVITRKDRSLYHFVQLDFKAVGDGVTNLQRRYPRWQDLSGCDINTRAFMAGYVSHLILDETWITNVFRPFFENQEFFESRSEALIMDRAMQLELDRANWESVSANLDFMRNADVKLEVDFFPTEYLYEWRDWVVGLLAKGFTWDRLRFMAQRISKNESHNEVASIAETFLLDPTQSTTHLLERFPDDLIRDFSINSHRNMVSAVNDFLI